MNQSTDHNENELSWIELTLTMPWSKVLLSAYFGTVISIKATGWVGSGSGYTETSLEGSLFRIEIDNPLLSPAPFPQI